MPELQVRKNTLRRRTPTQSRARHTVDSIKLAAIELAQKKGFASLTTIEIAARAGIAVGSLYEYFPNRESIFLSIFESTTEAFVSTIKAKVPAIMEAPLRKAALITATELLKGYREHKMVLLDLPEQMPELRLSGHALSFDQLIHGSLRLFLKHHRHADSHLAIERRAFIIEGVLIGGIQRYVNRAPENFPVKAFLAHLSAVVIDCIEGPGH